MNRRSDSNENERREEQKLVYPCLNERKREHKIKRRNHKELSQVPLFGVEDRIGQKALAFLVILTLSSRPCQTREACKSVRH